MRALLLRLCLSIGLALLPLAPALAITTGKLLEVEIDKGDVVHLARPAASVFIANPAVADVQVLSPTLVYVFGRGLGETQLFAVDSHDKVLANQRVVVSHNLSGLRRAIAEAMPGSDIKAASVEGGLMLSGKVDSAAEAEQAARLAARFVPPKTGEVINELAVTGATQVNLRVRVAEVSRSLSKQFGINWESAAQFGNVTAALGVGRDFLDSSGVIQRGPNSLGALALGYSSNQLDLNTLIDALASEGLVSVLAEPNLTAMSGETASFLAGGEFPIPITNSNGDVSVEYRQFGVSLNFTPTLVGNGRVNLRVRPEVSQLSTAGAVRVNNLEIPAIATRRAETTVELGSGQSFAIAGLLRNDVNSSVSKYPFLGDLPVLGALFRSSTFQADESELVIIVTPYLVRPSDARRLAAPTDGYTRPSDVDLILKGKVQGQPSAAAKNDVGPVKGPVGAVGYLLD
ncbi:pilus assembly protein CpaC [Tistlia consotensis]|uniref:Pilus assembly protein CpaC n=1 Tax=Tistlia consotensis USBA 355 TaxID=560819 RepID=A0A1Y6BNF3_9PROT|nr:type II and III secretion system protein family protein [Tistlia consotensis]SMF12634.1 pilus assembly protein CpaC [Tistlia consotensis USBA 355]SNR50985.1 pilus assembly protein CpaC [Tistlia consotensis]